MPELEELVVSDPAEAYERGRTRGLAQVASVKRDLEQALRAVEAANHRADHWADRLDSRASEVEELKASVRDLEQRLEIANLRLAASKARP